MTSSRKSTSRTARLPSPKPALGPTIVKTHSARHFLSLVPQLVGFTPTRSVVLVAFRGKRSLGAMRLDLPPADGDLVLSRFANTAIGLICKVHGIDGVAPVVYTDAPFGAGDTVPHAPLFAALETRAERAGLRVSDALCVAADGWGSYFDRDLPFGGRLLEDLELDDADAALTAGRPLLDPATAVVLPEVTPQEREQFVERVSAWNRPQEGNPYSRIDAFLDIAEPTMCIESLLAPVRPEDLDEWLGMLAALAAVPSLRDVVLLQFAWGPEFGRYVYQRTISGEIDEPLHPDGPIARAFTGGDFARPDAARITTAIERLQRAAALTAIADRAPLLTMIAWLHWALGHSTIAGDIVHIALGVDRKYGLATLLATMVNAGMVPEWAYLERSAQSTWRDWLAPSQRIA